MKLLSEGEINAQSGLDEQLVVDNDIVRFFNGKFAQAIELIPDEIKHLSEHALHERVGPSLTDWKLRQHFTDLIKEAKALNRETIPTTRVYEGIITRQTFHTTILTNPLKMAWVIRPVIDHTTYYSAIHQEALKKIFEMIRNTPVDPKYLPQILKLAERAADRVHGPVVQRMQIHSKNLNVEVNAKQLPPSENQEELTKKIEAMQAKLLEAPKDVTPADDDDEEN